MMKKYLLLSTMTLLLFSCAHGKTAHFPAVESPSEAAEVYVIRDNNLFGWGFSLKVALDGAIIAGLRSGEYISFYVKPGFHSLGIGEPTVTVPFEKERKYYFLISAVYSSFGFELRQIGDQQAESWLARTKPVQ
jgi:hypothetical protein